MANTAKGDASIVTDDNVYAPAGSRAVQGEIAPYDSAEDSDFDGVAAARAGVGADESASETENNEKETRVRKKRRLSLQNEEANGDSDESFVQQELDSGDEVVIQHAMQKKRRKKDANFDDPDDAGSESDFDSNGDDAGGVGGSVRTRRMRVKVQEERKKLARIDGATIDVDSIWNQMNNQLSTPVSRNKTAGEDATIASSKGDTSSKLPQEGMITIKRTYKFAGELITEEKLVPKDSAEAKLYFSTSNAAKNRSKNLAPFAGLDGQTNSLPETATESPLRRPLRRFSRFDPNPPDAIQKSWEKHVATKTSGLRDSAAKNPKLNTVMKSKLDWAAYVDKEGIKDDLDVHSKAKEGYMGRMDFLDRVDANREAERRNARLKNAGS